MNNLKQVIMKKNKFIINNILRKSSRNNNRNSNFKKLVLQKRIVLKYSKKFYRFIFRTQKNKFFKKFVC
jgi:hypothetical protein